MTAEEWVGQTIAGKYRVEALLGKGGMGLVLHARHVRLDEEVAIKLLLPEMLEVPGMITRFVREARAASKIKSQHVARVTDVDTLPDGVPYMVMEYLDGRSLAALRKRTGALEIPLAVRYVIEACDVIAEAHALGIIHRDLKPANLFITHNRDGDEILKVLDFGISKIDGAAEQDTTKTGQMMGSPKYMAPEQMLSMHDVDRRCDIWSLGAILYDLTAGRTPFVADTIAQLCSLVLHGKPPPPRQFRADLPEALEAIILRCLEREPAKRFADVDELVAALAPFAPPETRIPTPRGQPSSLRGTGSWSSLKPALAALVAKDEKLAEMPAEKLAENEKPTEIIPGALRTPISPSGTPPSMRSATVSAWHSDRSATRRTPRALVAGVTAALALAALGVLLLRSNGTPSPVASAPTSRAAVTPVASSDEAKLPSAAAPAPLPTASQAPSETRLAGEDGGAPVLAVAPAATGLHGRLKPPKGAGSSGAAQDDPFGGRRR